LIDTQQIRDGFVEGLGEIAGDEITYHNKEFSKQLRCIKWLDDTQYAEGIIVGSNGIRDIKCLHVLFLEDWLEGTEIEVTGYFVDSQGRWDFVEDFPILDKINPIAGIHNLVHVKLRRAEEYNNSSDGEFSIA